MFVARIEFYTMLMLSVIFLPFGVTERLAFLSNSAISLMFNSGAKMMVICFLQVMVAKILSAYLTNLQGNPFKDFSILCQLLIMCVFFAYVTKKLPELVSSFLNGSPALSGGGMIQQAKSAVQQTQQVITTAAMTVGTGVGAVGGASAAASANAGSGLSGKMSTLPGMKGKVGHAIDTFGVLARAGAQNYAAHNPLIRGYARGLKAVIGDNGDLQNQSFEKGLRRLAGLETGKMEPSETMPISDIAEHGYPPKKSGAGDKGGAVSAEQETSGNGPDAKGKDGTRVSHLKDLQTMDQEQRQQTISSMSNQEMQQLVQNLDMKEAKSLTQEQRNQLTSFKDQKDVDNMTKEQRQQTNSIVEKLAQQPKK